jgi:hypothetical protein
MSTTDDVDKMMAASIRSGKGGDLTHSFPPTVMIDENAVQKYVLISVMNHGEIKYFVRGSKSAK